MISDVYLQFRDGQTYQPKQVDPGVVTDVSWDYQEQGGLAQISATLAVPWETTGILPGDYMEAWMLSETVPRARGIVSTPENRLDMKESRTLLAFGRMADMDKVLDYKVIFHPSGSAQDLSYYAAELLSDYQQRKAVGAAFAPALDIDCQATSSNLESLTLPPGSVRSGFDQLYDQAGGNVVWGWDISPTTGNDRCYLRPRTSTVGHQFFVGDRVKLITAPAELVPVTNGVYFKGGAAKYPNLMTNASFEQPVNPSADTGSLLVAGGFEFGNPGQPYPGSGSTDALGWSLSNGATRNKLDPTSGHNTSPHTGSWYLLLDNPGEKATQDVAVTVGAAYLATCFIRAERGTPKGALTITGIDGGGNVTETPAGGVLALNAASAIWSGGAASAVIGSDALQTSLVFTNPATVKARITLLCSAGSSGHGLCIDDVTFGLVGAMGQFGWSTHLENPTSSLNAFPWIIWACKAAAWDGAYGVRASVIADLTHIPVIAPAGGDSSGQGEYHFKPAAGQALACGCFVRMAPGLNSGPGSARATYREWAGDGHVTQAVYGSLTTGNIPNDGLWHLMVNLVTAHGDAATATNQVEFGSTGVYDVDGFFARDQAAIVVEAQEPQAANYLRGADFERYVTAEQVCTSMSAADQAAASSYTTWGRREAALTNDQVVDWTADAQSYLQAYFQRAAVLLQRPRVELIGPADIVLPGDGVQVQVSGTGSDLAAQWCSHASYAWKKGSLDVSLDLSSERPTWAKMLKAASASGGSTGSSVGAPSGGGQTGGTTPVPASVASSTVSGTVLTHTDDPGGAPVVYRAPEVDALIDAESGVTAGTYTNATVTVDARGRVTAAVDGSGQGNPVIVVIGPFSSAPSPAPAIPVNADYVMLDTSGAVGVNASLPVIVASTRPLWVKNVSGPNTAALSTTDGTTIDATGSGSVSLATGQKTLFVPRFITGGTSHWETFA